MNRILVQLTVIGALTTACLLGVDRSGSAGIARATESAFESAHANRLHGRYGYDATGTFIGVGDFSANGVVNFRPDGTLTATETGNLNGEVFYVTFTGSYTIDSSDTGTITTIDDTGAVSVFDLVLTAHRERGSAVPRDEGVVTLLHFERQ